MHNISAVLTKQIFREGRVGGRTAESDDNSQLLLGWYQIGQSEINETVRSYTPLPAPIKHAKSQLTSGLLLAMKSFSDSRSIDEIAKEVAEKFDGSGGSSAADGCYRIVEFPTKVQDRIMDLYFK